MHVSKCIQSGIEPRRSFTWDIFWSLNLTELTHNNNNDDDDDDSKKSTWPN